MKTPQYCAFGTYQKDKTGTIIEESENYYIIKSDGWFQPVAWKKEDVITFTSEEERNEWVNEQHFLHEELL